MIASLTESSVNLTIPLGVEVLGNAEAAQRARREQIIASIGSDDRTTAISAAMPDLAGALTAEVDGYCDADFYLRAFDRLWMIAQQSQRTVVMVAPAATNSFRHIIVKWQGRQRKLLRMTRCF